MRKPKKAPVKAKGARAPKPTGGKRGVGPGKARGFKVHGKPIVPHHRVTHPAQPHAPVKKAKAPKKRGWSPGWDVDCCTAEAIGVLLGLPADEVLELDAAADRTIEGTLELAGVRGVGVGPPFSSYRPVFSSHTGLILGVTLPQPHAVAVTPDGTWWSWGEPFNPLDWPELVVEEAWWLCGG